MVVVGPNEGVDYELLVERGLRLRARADGSGQEGHEDGDEAIPAQGAPLVRLKRQKRNCWAPPLGVV
jgi:hypothetical protein